MSEEQLLFFCETCDSECELTDDGECEGNGFYEWPDKDITCPCCGDLVAEFG